MRQSIESAVQKMRSHPECPGDEIFQCLLDDGIDRRVAAQLVVLLPQAYGRVGLDGSGVLFSNEYVCLDEAGKACGKGWLDDLPLWKEVIAFARQEMSNGVTGDALLAIAGRSAVINSINKALHAGENFQNLVCGPTVSIWPEFVSSVNSGPVAEQKLRWWKIWTWFKRSLPSNYSRAEKWIATGTFGAAILVGLLALGVVGYYAVSLWRAVH